MRPAAVLAAVALATATRQARGDSGAKARQLPVGFKTLLAAAAGTEGYSLDRWRTAIVCAVPLAADAAHVVVRKLKAAAFVAATNGIHVSKNKKAACRRRGSRCNFRRVTHMRRVRLWVCFF